MVVRENAVQVFREIVDIFSDKNEVISPENMALFKDHVPLISIGTSPYRSNSAGLFEIFKTSDGTLKLEIFRLIKSVFTEGIKLFPQCLPSLLSLLSPCLLSSNEDLNDATWEFMHWLRKAFKEFFFGSLWMSLKRNKVGRLGLISYLRHSISNHSDWVESREVCIESVKQVLLQKNLEGGQMEKEEKKDFRLRDEEDSEGSTLFEESDHEEETTIESKLRVYLESFLEDFSGNEKGGNKDEDSQPQMVELENLADQMEEEEITLEKQAEPGMDPQNEEEVPLLNGPDAADTNDPESNESEEESRLTQEEDPDITDEYYLVVKEKLMKKFDEQLTEQSEKLAMSSMMPDSNIAASAIMESLRDPSKFVKKSILDLLFNELGPEFGLFSVRASVEITRQALLLLESHDYSIQRKLFKYFNSPEVQRVLKGFNQVDYNQNSGQFHAMMSKTEDDQKRRGLVKLFLLTEGVRGVFRFDPKDPLVMRVLHVTRALIAENRKYVPLVFELVLPDMLKFLLDLQKWFFLNSNASAKKSERFLIKFLRVLQPALPNLLYSLSQTALFEDLPPLSIVYKMAELRQTSLQILKSKSKQPSSFQRLLGSRFYGLPGSSQEDSNKSFFEVVFVQFFLRGLFDHPILRGIRNFKNVENLKASSNEHLQSIIALLKDEDSLRELFLCMELLDNLLGGFNSQSQLTVIDLGTLLFATQISRLLKCLLHDANTFSKVSFDAEDFVAKIVKCLALLELFIYSGLRVAIRCGVDLRRILLDDPGYKELMGYVEGHNSALFNPFSQSMLDFKKGIYALENKDQSDFLLSKVDVSALIGQPKVSAITRHLKSEIAPKKQQNLEMLTPKKGDYSKPKEFGEELSEQDEDLADRLRNIDSNLVTENLGEEDFQGLMDSREISNASRSFKEGMFDFINFFIEKHRTEKRNEKKQMNQSKKTDTLNLTKSETVSEVKIPQKPSDCNADTMFLKSTSKSKPIVIKESQGKRIDSLYV